MSLIKAPKDLEAAERDAAAVLADSCSCGPASNASGEGM